IKKPLKNPAIPGITGLHQGSGSLMQCFADKQKTTKPMIKLLSHQKVRLHLLVLSSFLVTASFGHNVTSEELLNRMTLTAPESILAPMAQGTLVTGTIIDDAGLPVPGVN